MKNEEQIKQLEKRIEALEQRFAETGKMIKEHPFPSLHATYSPSEGFNIHSHYAFPLESVKEQVTELLKAKELPDWAEWVSIDIDGDVFYRNEKPISNDEYWKSNEEKCLSHIPLNGADWTQCCWKISDLLGDSDVKKNFTTENNETIPDTQPDWENFFRYDDFIRCIGLNHVHTLTSVNRAIHERMKPLLDDNNALENEVNRLNKQCIGLAKQKAELEAERNKLTSVITESVFSKKPNTIEVPFRLDPDGDVMFRDDNNATSCFYSILSDLNIDQTKIKRILLEMKSEVEE